jgi:hypothetical protein
MDASALQKVCQQVYARFPNLRGVQPTVTVQEPPASADKRQARDGTRPSYLLVFRTQASTADGKAITFWVRAVADSQGKILKLTTSR